jgi:hypothetical protein
MAKVWELGQPCGADDIEEELIDASRAHSGLHRLFIIYDCIKWQASGASQQAHQQRQRCRRRRAAVLWMDSLWTQP